MERTKTATANGTETPACNMAEVERVMANINYGPVRLRIARQNFTPERDNLATSLECVERIGRKYIPNFIIDKDNRFVYENVLRWCNNDPEARCIDPVTKNRVPADPAKGVYLAGPTGTGKTWCLEVIRLFCRAKGTLILLGNNSRELLAWPTYHSREICSAYRTEESVDRFVRSPVLCINDLGGEPEDFVHMGTRGNPLQEVIERRGDRPDRLTLVTSNLRLDMGPESRLCQKYGDRVASRLRGMCNYYELTGRDRRE